LTRRRPRRVPGRIVGPAVVASRESSRTRQRLRERGAFTGPAGRVRAAEVALIDRAGSPPNADKESGGEREVGGGHTGRHAHRERAHVRAAQKQLLRLILLSQILLLEDCLAPRALRLELGNYVVTRWRCGPRAPAPAPRIVA
jgi:hypothetical protein